MLKYTPDDNPDKEILPEVIKMIKEYLTKVNIESGKSENIFELAQLDQQLEFRANEKIVSHPSQVVSGQKLILMVGFATT